MQKLKLKTATLKQTSQECRVIEANVCISPRRFSCRQWTSTRIPKSCEEKLKPLCEEAAANLMKDMQEKMPKLAKKVDKNF